MIDKACGTCRYWRSVDGVAYGECRLGAPSSQGPQQEPPLTYPGYWCGEHEAKEVPPDGTRAGRWGYSADRVFYIVESDTAEQAVEAAIAAIAAIAEIGDPGDGRIAYFWVAEFRDPIAPEACLGHAAEMLLEAVAENEEHSQHGIAASADQRLDLNAVIRSAFASWLDRNGLRPRHGIAKEGTRQKWRAEEGVARKLSDEAAGAS